jgi:hypothetical protein
MLFPVQMAMSTRSDAAILTGLLYRVHKSISHPDGAADVRLWLSTTDSLISAGFFRPADRVPNLEESLSHLSSAKRAVIMRSYMQYINGTGRSRMTFEPKVEMLKYATGIGSKNRTICVYEPWMHVMTACYVQATTKVLKEKLQYKDATGTYSLPEPIRYGSTCVYFVWTSGLRASEIAQIVNDFVFFSYGLKCVVDRTAVEHCREEGVSFVLKLLNGDDASMFDEEGKLDADHTQFDSTQKTGAFATFRRWARSSGWPDHAIELVMRQVTMNYTAGVKDLKVSGTIDIQVTTGIALTSLISVINALHAWHHVFDRCAQRYGCVSTRLVSTMVTPCMAEMGLDTKPDFFSARLEDSSVHPWFLGNFCRMSLYPTPQGVVRTYGPGVEAYGLHHIDGPLAVVPSLSCVFKLLKTRRSPCEIAGLPDSKYNLAVMLVVHALVKNVRVHPSVPFLGTTMAMLRRVSWETISIHGETTGKRKRVIQAGDVIDDLAYKAQWDPAYAPEVDRDAALEIVAQNYECTVQDILAAERQMESVTHLPVYVESPFYQALYEKDYA